LLLAVLEAVAVQAVVAVALAVIFLTPHCLIH
jgi:hypothetical protein